MAEPNETHVVYKAIADFASLRRELTKTKAALAEMKAAEDAYNAASAAGSPAATKAAQARAQALQKQAQQYRAVITQLNRYTKASVAQTTATKASSAAIRSQNQALAANARRFAAAAAAARDYAKAQKKPIPTAKTDGDGSGAAAASRAARAMKDEAIALAATSTGRQKKIRELKEEAQVVNLLTGEITSASDATKKLGSATDGLAVSTQKYKRDANGVMQVVFDSRDAMKDGARATQQASNAYERARNALRNWANDSDRTISAQRRLRADTTNLYRAFVKFGNWRPRLVPPFVALIPIIGAVVAAINPLVAIIGSLSPLVVGLAGNVGSLAGAFLALPGILSGVVAGITSVIASMGGVGSVFKAYGAMRKAIQAPGTGGGGRGETQAERAERLADAEWNLQKAQRAVLKAQENLNKARERALQDLINLRIEVSRASMNEERAIANLAQAQQDYWDTMADPGSTAADKLDAVVSIKEAEADLQDVRQKNIDNQRELNELEAKGIDQSDAVLDAQERLTDAVISQRDAQKALSKEQTGTAAGASAVAKATDEFAEALAKLSPSARAVVLAIIALEDQWKAMRLSLQETFFSQFVGDMDKLPQIIRNIEAFLKPAAAAMGMFVSGFLTLMSSPEWTTDLSTIGEQNGVVLTQLGTAALFLMTALKDLIIAAGPFTEWMVTGFAEGSKRFSEFIANARETGSLANWLLKVEERLQRWWAIIKNISATLFNYSAAATDFGDWLSDGFLKTTEGWRKASQEARREGSPFKAYLEDVKPLLQEVKGLFGDFFGWLRREMMDPENIQGGIDLLQVIRNDLGPALSRFLDTLSEADIDVKFVHALSSIIDSLSAIMEKGGAVALEQFFTVLVGFFDALAVVVNAIPSEFLTGLLSFIGGLAAITFIGKFTGLTALIGSLAGLSGKAGTLGGLFTNLKGLDRLKFLGILGLVTALVDLPGALGGIRDLFNSALGVDMSTIESSSQYLANSRDLLGRKNTNAYATNEFNQSRNWLFDAGRQIIGSDAAWQRVDDQLREILKTGDIEAFQKAWATVVKNVGSDASQIWSLTVAEAEKAGIKLDDTSTKIRVLGEQSKESEQRISDLRGEISLLGDSSKNQGRAFDTLAASIEKLGTLPRINVGDLNAQTTDARNLRDAFREIDTDARNAADAVLANGGSVEEAKAKYDEGRKAIEDYLIELGLGPAEARTWADGQLGPADEVIAKFGELKTEYDKLARLNDIKLKLSLQLEGFGKELPTTMVGDREVIDFAALGKQNPKKPAAKPSNPVQGFAGGGGGGGGGGGFSVGLAKPINLGLSDQVTKETTEAQGKWNNFWAVFTRPIPGPLGMLQSMVGSAFSWVTNNVFRPFENAGNNLRTAFDRIVQGISAAWSSIQNAFTGPVNFVIDRVYNNGIRAFWNNLAGKLNMNHLALPAGALVGGSGFGMGAGAGAAGGRFATGGVLPGYTPGRDVHDFYSPTAGNLHLSGGEAIMRPEWTKAVGGKKAVAQMNSDARNNRFALGGVLGLGLGAAGGGGNSRNTGTKGARRVSSQQNQNSWVSEIAGGAKLMLDFFKDPVGMVTRGAQASISGILAGIGGGSFGGILSAMPNFIISGLANQAKDSVPTYGGAMNGGGHGMGWQAMIEIVRSQFPGTRLNSGFRPGDPTMHGKGRAIDIPPNAAHFAWLRKNFPQSQALIYSPMGGQQLLNGRPYVWPEPYKSTHYDHIHWGMKDGGVLPKLYDQGGWIPNGGMAVNLSGKPEAVLNPSESAALKSLLSGAGLAARPAFGASAATAISPVSSAVDASVNIEHVTIVNPTPEKVSDSLPKAIRKIGYMKNAREGLTP